ncbi:hypothetical protein [Sphingobacterium sp. G1-14]|uniref:hypothetical protein n=1 Tax=Sphingobacterium TaxID=28453 RepID=UPI0012FE5B41|nr:hypothetical protein [Sphingobacterium sp. G1-14]
MIIITTNSSSPIAANVVIGTTVFSDIGESYVDFFRGRSIIERNSDGLNLSLLFQLFK